MSFKLFNIDLMLTLGSRVGIIAGGFLTSILTARYLGPDGRGNYFFVTTLIAILSQFCNCGLHSSNTYLIAKHPKLLPQLTANSFWVSCVIGASITGLVILSLNLREGSWLALILVPTTLFYMLGINLLVGLHKIKAFNWFQISSNLSVVFAIVIAGYLQLESTGFIAATAISWTISATILLFYLFSINSISLRFDRKIFVQGCNYALRAYIASLLSFFILKGNILFLKHYCDNTILGYFSIASQVNDVLIVLPTSVGLLLFPKLIKNTQNRWQETKHTLVIMSWLMFVLCLITALLIKPFIRIAFSQAFEPAADILIWMLPGAFFFGLISIILQYVAAIGFPNMQLYLWGFAFFLTTLLNILLISNLAATGAAIALSTTYCILFCMIYTLANHTEKKLNSTGGLTTL